MPDVAEKIRTLLLSLGGTPDEVALNVERLGITGTPDDGCTCPIARLIQATFPETADQFDVPPEWDGFDAAAYYVTATEVYTPAGRVLTPSAVDEFIRWFDGHRYPALEEPKP